MKAYGDLDSKFRFVILASKRAKQLLQGAKPKIKTKSKNLIQVAQKEVKQRLIDYEIVQPRGDDFQGAEDEAFIGEELGIGDEGIPKESVQVKILEKAKEKLEEKPAPQKKAKASKPKASKKKSTKKD